MESRITKTSGYLYIFKNVNCSKFFRNSKETTITKVDQLPEGLLQQHDTVYFFISYPSHHHLDVSTGPMETPGSKGRVTISSYSSALFVQFVLKNEVIQ